MEESVFICPGVVQHRTAHARAEAVYPCLLEKGNVFANLLTGFGKSLVFQCLPIVADIIHMRDRG